ncbi:hypothetical protein N8893_01845 [Porticoccaceae bacterium]|nr:hypothetical protein [Porticoccaceae bacterium]
MNKNFVNRQSLEDLKRLDHEETYSQHNIQFESIAESLSEFYKDYENKDKIIQLLNAWLYFIRGLNESYGVDAVKEFGEGEFGCPIRFSFYYEYGFNIGNKASIYKSKFLFSIFNAFLRRPLLPGAKVHSIYSKLRWRFAKFIIINIPIQRNYVRKSQLIEYIMKYFDGYFNEEDTVGIKSSLSCALPDVFCSDQVNVTTKKELNVECASWTFLEFSGFEKIFLLNRTTRVKGLQHGGGYFAYDPQYGTQFEESISDRYIGWGLSPGENERQHRYTHNYKNKNSPVMLTRLIWVEGSKSSIFNYFMWPKQIQQNYNLNSIAYISDEIRLTNISHYSMPYPKYLRSDQYDRARGIELPNITGLGENNIRKGDILIFDESGQSLIHFCVEQQVPFIFIISRNDISGFSEKQVEWFDLMRAEKLAFFEDETGKLSARLVELFETEYELPEKLSNFQRKTFIDI